MTASPLRESVLVGWSLGGMLLLEALAQPRAPRRLPRSWWGWPRSSVEGPAIPGVSRWPRSGPCAGPEERSEPGPEDFVRACLAPGEESFRDEAAAGFDFTANAAHLAPGLDYLKDKDLCGLLPHIPGPVAIIQGEQDGIVDPAQAQFLREHLPDAIASLAGRRASAFSDPVGSL